jgi:hypothetical protein
MEQLSRQALLPNEGSWKECLRSLFSFRDMRGRSFGAVLDVGGKSAIDGSLAMAKIERQRLKGSDCEWLS